MQDIKENRAIEIEDFGPNGDLGGLNIDFLWMNMSYQYQYKY